MADDITLTVRVRDATRRPLAQLSARLQRMERDLHARSGRDNMFDRASQSLARFQRRLGTSNAFVGRFRRGLNNVVSGAITPLRRGLDGLGNVTRRVFRLGERSVAGLRRGLHGAFGPLTRLIAGVWRLGQMFGRLAAINKTWTAIIVAALLLIGAAAQALGALLVTALGGAFVALGAYALRGNEVVKGAFQDMKHTIGGVVRDAAKPLIGPLASAMGHIGDVAVQLGPQLRQAFEATGPIVMSFSRAIGNLASDMLPGMVAALEESKGAMAGFEKAMGLIGKGFGDMFHIITHGNDEELARAWVTFGNEIRNVLESLGQFISTALKSGTASMIMIGFFRLFTGALNVVAAVLKTVDTLTLGLFTHLADSISGFQGLDATIGSSFKYSNRELSTLKTQLEAVNAEIKERQDAAKSVPGPAKERVRDMGQEGSYNKLLKTRQELMDAVKSKTDALTKANRDQAQSLKSVLDKMRELNDLNRGSLDARAAQQQALIEANKGYKDLSGALRMNNGQLDLTNQKALDAYQLLSKLASSTNEATKAAQDAHEPWTQVQATWKTGYDNIVRLADGMGLTDTQARDLADTILGMPPGKDIVFQARTKEAIDSLDGVISAIKAAPGKKEITVKTLSADAMAALEELGFKIKRLPDGKFKISALTGRAKDDIRGIQTLRDALKNKTISIDVIDRVTAEANRAYRAVQALHSKTITLTTEHRTIYTGKGGRGPNAGGATGGLVARVPRKATGGAVQSMPDGGFIRGPGGPTSDSILAMLPSGPVRVSDSEFVLRASAVSKYGTGFLNALNAGRFPRFPGFAKGGVTKSEAKARSEATGELTLSHFGIMAGYRNDEFRHQLGLPETLGSLVDDLNKWRRVIQKSTHGALEKSLNKQLDKAGKALIKYEKAHEKVSKQLDAAKEKLSGLKQAAAQLKDSVKQGIISGADITKSAAAEDSRVTINTLLSQMSANAANATQFSGMLKELAKRGVDKNIIQQIAEAGIEGGGMETAAAILGGSSSDIKRLNQLEGQIIKAGDSAGKTAADAMYAAGIKAAQGLVDGLTKKKKDIEKVMMDIAKSMEKAIKKALGIKSPSRVMMKVGHHTAEGFALGMEKNTKVARSWESMLNVGPSAGVSAGGGGGSYGNRPLVIQLSLGGKDIGEVIIDPLRKSISHRGGNVQAVLGR